MKKILEFLVTGCYSGYSPFAPGTAGTLVAIPLFLILAYLPLASYLALLVLSLIPVALLCQWGEKHFAVEDPSAVVIDEIIGYLVTMTALPINPFNVIMGFFLFRAFDVIKPFPVYQSQKLPYGWGILIDDVLAGIYANLSLWIIYLICRFLGGIS